MNGVELARQVAADLHAQAVARGLDPWLPYDFAVKEARRRDLDVEATASGAALLNSGRATFLPNERLILHENVGTPFEQAFLVAHEIGHAALGDDPEIGESAYEIDPSRCAEASPTGINRVVDYGRRQRRELQMDLFAREFLLPRTVVRKLHIEDNLTASAIAEKLGAPFDVVAQQLLDALMLPPIKVKVEQEKAERPPNAMQRDAARHRGKAYLLEAGPGTGKTQTLVARVEGLLEEGIDPRRILLLTFSNKAAGEMTERIALKQKDAAAAMWIGTFHAFGLDLIRRFHTELNLPKEPRMLDRTEAVELIEHEFSRLSLAHYRNLHDPTQNIVEILSAISRAKDEVVDEQKYAALAGVMLRQASTASEREAAEKAIEVARVYEFYETLKRKEQCVDFGDLVSMPVRLLEGNTAVRLELQAQYDHVLVDEYQDVNRSSIRLLAALRVNGENLWAVGDAKQSIYRFRGASSFNMHRFGREDFSGGELGHLKRNYRSVGEIVDAFSAFAIGMKAGSSDSALEADRGISGLSPELRKVSKSEQQTLVLAEAIEEMHRAGHSYRDQAILCTGNEKLAILGQELERLGVPVLFLGSLFERPEIKDLFALLTLLTDGRAMGLVRVACWPEFQMPIADVAAILDQIRVSPAAPGAWLRNLGALSGITEEGLAATTKLAAALDGFDQSESPWKVLAKVLLDRTSIAKRIACSEDTADRTRGIAIWQLLNFIRTQPAGRGLPIVRLLERVRRLLRLSDERDLRHLPAAAQGIDAVRLMTIHGAKGLEFPVVHLPGLNQDTIPRKSPAPQCPPPEGMIEGGTGSSLDIFEAGQAEEQECLFYVALSRARDRLLIYAPTEKSNGQKRPLSPFLSRLGPGLVPRDIRSSNSLPPAPEEADVQLSVTGGLCFSEGQLALYDSCPRRFFYTHILQIGGRRVTTPFMQMHDAVRTVFQSIVNGTPEIAREEEVHSMIAEAFAIQGLAEHGYADDYRAFAVAMIRYFALSRKGYSIEQPDALTLNFGIEKIIVRPDDYLIRADGIRIYRNVRTGHRRSADSEDVRAAALMLAAKQAFPNAISELVYLSDELAQPLTMSAKQLQNRREKLAAFLRDIRLGRFVASPSSRTCPGCPAFFVCGPTPPGTLVKKFG